MQSYILSEHRYTYPKDMNDFVKGTLSELKVIQDLILRGYEVFTHMNTMPTTAFDLFAYSRVSSKGLRVEVTTGAIKLDDEGDKVLVTPLYKKHERTEDHWDIIAVVFYNGVRYYRKIPTPNVLEEKNDWLENVLIADKETEHEEVTNMPDVILPKII